MAEKKLPKGIRKNGNRYQGRIMFHGKIILLQVPLLPRQKSYD